MIELSQYTENRWHVIRCEQRKRGGIRRKHLGTVEHHSFRDEHGQQAGFWLAKGSTGAGWHAPVRRRCTTKGEAVDHVVKETAVPYQERSKAWKRRI